MKVGFTHEIASSRHSGAYTRSRPDCAIRRFADDIVKVGTLAILEGPFTDLGQDGTRGSLVVILDSLPSHIGCIIIAYNVDVALGVSASVTMM